MPPSKFRFAFGSESKESGILCQDSCFEHMRYDRSAISFPDGVNYVPEPGTNVRPWYAVKLQRQRHDLLREEVGRLRGGHDRVDLALAPQRGQGKGDKELLIVGRKKETVPVRTASTACSSHALQERRDARWCANLNYPVKVTNVEPEFERGRSNDHAVRLLGERALRLPSFVER
jgi:hypothetical protein